MYRRLIMLFVFFTVAGAVPAAPPDPAKLAECIDASFRTER